jgi:prephenate dehydrogenase
MSKSIAADASAVGIRHSALTVSRNVARTLPVIRESRRDPGPPIFQRIAIVGFGLIGGSIALACRERFAKGLIIAVDRKDVLEHAMRLHAADVGADDLVMAAEADLVILAAPVLQNIDVLRDLADHVTGEAIVTDVGSTKRQIVEAARALPDRLTFIGGHPLAGAAVGGLHAARADLFQRRPWIVTPASGRDDAGVLRLTAFIEALGARVEVMEPAEHDLLLAHLSHLPQIAISALMHVIGERAGAEGLALSGRGLRDTTRLASSPAGIWRDIVATNSDYIGSALDELITVLQQLRADGRQEELQRIFESAARWKETLDSPES